MSYENNIWKMYAFKFLRDLHFIGGALIPFWMTWGGISFSQIMILQSFFTLSIFALEAPTGAIADYFGRKTSLIMGAIVNAIAAIVYAWKPSFALFILAEFIWAISIALISGADQALVYDSLKKIKKETTAKKVLAKMRTAELSAMMIAAPIGSWIASSLSPRYTMMFMAIPVTIAAIIGLTLKEPKTKQKKETKRYKNILVGGIKYFKGHKILRALAFDSILIRVFTFYIIWMYQPKLIALGIPIIYFGFMHAGLTGTEMLFMNKFSYLEKLFKGKKNYLLWSAIITGISFFALGINTYIPLTIILILTISGFGLSRHIYHESYLNKHIESHNRATVLSSMSMLYSFIRAAIYPIIGLIVEWNLNYSFMILGVIIIISAITSKVTEEHLID